MRKILFILILTNFNSFSQSINDCKQTNDIVTMERLNHKRLQGPSFQNYSSASDNFDIKYYRLEFEIDPAVRFIKGKVTVYFKLLSSSNNISLDLTDNLIIDSISQRNDFLQYEHLNNALKITFPKILLAGEIDSVSIFYEGIPASTGFGSFIQSSHAGIPIIWTLSEPYGSRDWWPCKNGLDDKADSIDVFITHPSQYNAASNGLLQSIIVDGNNTVTHWKHRYPIASYLICFAVTNYAVLNDSVQLTSTDLPMQTFCYPENKNLFQENTPLVLYALQLYDKTFGEYPFKNEKYGHVQFGWGGGMEHQTSTFIVTPAESLMAHELGHQWFGDKITCGSWQDIWLNEGFATHLASFYMEQKYPEKKLATRKAEIDNITSLPDGSVFVDDTTDVNRIFNGRLSYTKGSHLLYMLRWKLGDSIFFEGLRQYQKDSMLTYRYARTEDLKRNLEKVSGKDLTEFFREWFYGQGYPSYTLQWNPVGINYVSLKLSQVTSHPSVSFFQIPVAIEFKNATQQKTIIVDNTFNNQVFLSDIGFVADTVLIDPDYWLISKNNISQRVNDNIFGENIIQVFPNPVQEQFSIYIRNFSLPSASLNIYNAAGQCVLHRDIRIYNNSYFEILPSTKLAKGIYFLKIVSGNNFKFTKKIIKS